jgi:hypothetical protein
LTVGQTPVGALDEVPYFERRRLQLHHQIHVRSHHEWKLVVVDSPGTGDVERNSMEVVFVDEVEIEESAAFEWL